MPPLEDPTIREKILEALSHSESGEHVQFTRQAESGRLDTIPRVTKARLVDVVRQWTSAGKKINQAKEHREPYCRHHEYHYDFKIKFGEKLIYIETVLDQSRNDYPELIVVNIHLAD